MRGRPIFRFWSMGSILCFDVRGLFERSPTPQAPLTPMATQAIGALQGDLVGRTRSMFHRHIYRCARWWWLSLTKTCR